MGELSPGSTLRRWEPEGGVGKHRERIHKESKFADEHKNLPFSFSKPKKQKPINTIVRCDFCEKEAFVTETTVAVICRHCNKFYRVTDKNKVNKRIDEVTIIVSGDSDDNL